MKFKSFSTFKAELLSDPEVKAEYDRLGPEYQLISQIIAKRLKMGLSQLQLAKKIGTQQSAISRLESGSYNPSLAFLNKVSSALGYRLSISLQ